MHSLLQSSLPTPNHSKQAHIFLQDTFLEAKLILSFFERMNHLRYTNHFKPKTISAWGQFHKVGRTAQSIAPIF